MRKQTTIDREIGNITKLFELAPVKSLDTVTRILSREITPEDMVKEIESEQAKLDEAEEIVEATRAWLEGETDETPSQALQRISQENKPPGEVDVSRNRR